MKSYVVIDRVARFGPGTVLGLTSAQADSRRHYLETVDAKAGVYRTTARVEFKAGEEIDLEGAVPKALAAIVVDPKTAAQAGKSKAAKSKAAKSKAANKAPAPASQQAARPQAAGVDENSPVSEGADGQLSI